MGYHRAVPRARARLAALTLLPVLLAGCGGAQSTLDPHSHAARDISTLWWWMLAAACVVLFGALFLIGLGWLSRRREGFPFLRSEGRARSLVVTFGIVVPLASVIIVFVVANFSVAKQTDAPAPSSTQLTIHVIGKQWFWVVRYPGTTAVTANEIHIPARTRVNVVAQTADVIHSLWVPELNRKIDMIPGRQNRVLLYADKPGVYRGQCAEFCGLEHAHMGMYVVADPPARFRAWLANMARTRQVPATAAAKHGEQVFLSSQCASCHQIRGTAARGQVGPDLTHLQTRMSLAALTIPNRKGYLAGWVLDPQHTKPGNKMPGLDIRGRSFQDLLAYLESLR